MIFLAQSCSTLKQLASKSRSNNEVASFSGINLVLILYLNKVKTFSALLFRRLSFVVSVTGFIRNVTGFIRNLI